MPTSTPPRNDLNPRQWREYEADGLQLSSLWQFPARDQSLHPGAAQDFHGAFIPQVAKNLILRYTKAGDYVLDLFAGSGTTLFVAHALGRGCLAMDLDPDRVRALRKKIPAEPTDLRYEVWQADTTDRGLPNRVSLGSAWDGAAWAPFQLAILHPPYWQAIKFSEHPRDLSNQDSPQEFKVLLWDVTANAKACLAPDGILAVVIGDYQRGQTYHSLGFMAMEIAQRQGLTLIAHCIKDLHDTAGKGHKRNLWKYRTLRSGTYLFGFEHILIFRNSI